MNPPVRSVTLPLFFCLFSISSAIGAGERLTFDPVLFSTGNFHGCPAAGEGSDPYLNSLKNRDDRNKFPATVRLYTVSKLLAAAPKNLPKRRIHRSKWTTAQQDLAAKWESRAVMIEGYLIHKAVKEGEEACNCKSDEYVDHHMWLAPSATSARTRGMVVEVSPRVWSSHPGWDKATTFNRVITDKSKVRVTGWLTWDQEHKEQLGKTRGTLWEVHPIHAIQVLKGNKWVAL